MTPASLYGAKPGKIAQSDMRRLLRILSPQGGVFEIRVLGLRGKSRTDSGYFDDVDAAVDALGPYLKLPQAKGIYTTFNELQPALLARSENAFKEYADLTTGDGHITSIRWLFIDLDPERVSGVAADDDEHAAAMVRAEAVRDWLLAEHGFHAPVVLDSGNGAYLLFPVLLPNTAESVGLVNRVLQAIASRFNDAAVKVDTAVGNPARIMRVAGTWNRKGSDTAERPWRQCRLIEVPDYLEGGHADPVSVEKLEAVAALAPLTKTAKSRTATTTISRSGAAKSAEAGDTPFKHRLKVGEWLYDRGVVFTTKEPDDGRAVHAFDCPFNPEHIGEANITQHASGAVTARCFHGSCSGKTLDDFKQAIGKPGPEHYDPPLDTSLFIGKPEGQTELANSQRFVRRFGDDVKFVATWGKWLVWRGSHWAEDDGSVATMQFAKLVAQGVFDEARDCLNDDTIDFAKKTARHSGCRAMLNLAASDLAIAHSGLDADQMLLNATNGTVDLRTGELRQHRREDHLTKIVRVAFNPNATCPQWDQFILDIFPSPGLAAFVRRLVGYCLTGDVSEQVMPIFWGVGANGKSTFLTALQWILQHYAGQAPASLLALKKGEQHPTEVAGLHGKRLVVASETEGGCLLAEALVKQLTGGDPIPARRMREDFWTFNPTHKLVLCTNHRPRVRGTDHGIWRRLLLVPFSEVFDGPRKDPQLPAKLATEAEGILAWAVRGCLEWQRDGLKPPEEVQAATREYRSSEDVIGRFVMDCCEVGSSSMSCRFADLYAAFKAWCEQGGERCPNAKTVSAWLTDNSFEKFRNNGSSYRGIEVKGF